MSPLLERSTVAGDRATVRGRSRRGRRPMSEINVTPFVDVMLVLLVVFMVTAPLLTTGVDVDLPQAGAGALRDQDEPLTVSVDAAGRVFIAETEVTLDALGPQLQAVAGRNPELRIFVRGDRAIDYGRVMQVVGAINAAGYAKVALLTDPRARTGSDGTAVPGDGAAGGSGPRG